MKRKPHVKKVFIFFSVFLSKLCFFWENISLFALSSFFWWDIKPSHTSWIFIWRVPLNFPCGSAGKESACNVWDLGPIDSWVGKIPLKKERLPTPVFWPREFEGPYSPLGHKESDTTERLSLTQQIIFHDLIKRQLLLLLQLRGIVHMTPQALHR